LASLFNLGNRRGIISNTDNLSGLGCELRYFVCPRMSFPGQDNLWQILAKLWEARRPFICHIQHMNADLIQSQREGIVMEKLSSAERELVALGAALGSNCVPCIEYHIPEARKAGLSDRQINEAIRLADKVRQVPARKVLAAALGMLPEAHAGTHAEQSGPDYGQPVPDGGTEQPSCG
jgi:AhpD family alkylhydroperoxidase